MQTAALTAGDLCTRSTVIAGRTLALGEAARLMRDQHVGSVVVVDDTLLGHMPVGMLTDRDIVTAVVAKGVDVQTLQVGDVMSTDLATTRETDSLLDALDVMRRHGVRRVPVTDARGVLQGVLSLDDVTEVVGEQISALVQALTSGHRREQRRRR
jgi:signal-transduction protein with cAMP-binding, CBS, and nucleotidyltransferase domain